MQKSVTFRFFRLLILFLLGLGCSFNPSQLFPEQTIDPLPPSIARRAISQDFKENLVWRKDGIGIRHLPLPSSELLIGAGYVAFVNFLGGPLSMINQLEVVDAHTGNTVWRSERFSDYEDVAVVGDKAFVLLNEGKLLNIYDVKGDGKPLHSSDKYFKAGTIFYLFPVAEGEVILYYQQGDEYSIHTIDSKGVEVGNSRKIQGLSFLFLFDQPFFLSTGAEYIGGNFRTGEELWRIPAPGQIYGRPILQDNILIISAGDGRRYALMAIDIRNGHKLWKTEKIFGSNVVLYEGNLYALRNDAVLVKLDPKTCQTEDEISFTPNSIDAGFSAYWLASDGERLFVYFGDSQELFALEL